MKNKESLKPVKVIKATKVDEVKIIEDAPMEVKKEQKEKPQATKWQPEVGEKALFTNADGVSGVASIQSLEPFVLVEHTIKNGCHSEAQINVNSLDGFTIKPLTKEELYARLS
jgi:hypothetical protein